MTKIANNQILQRVMRLGALSVMAIAAFSVMADKQPQPTPEQRAKALREKAEALSIENKALEHQRDSLRAIISGSERSPLVDSVATLRNTLADLRAQEATLKEKMKEQGNWVSDYLPRLIAEKQHMMEMSVFEMNDADLAAYAEELKTFAGEPTAEEALEEIRECQDAKRQIAKLREAVDSPLMPQQLQDAEAAYADLKKALRESEALQLTSEIGAPLSDYAGAAATFIDLAEGFNTYGKVKGMRGHVAKNPDKASNYSGPILNFFAQYCRENADKIKTLQSVPYFKRQWEAYAAQLRRDPFTTPGAVESEIANLGYKPIPQ